MSRYLLLLLVTVKLKINLPWRLTGNKSAAIPTSSLAATMEAPPMSLFQPQEAVLLLRNVAARGCCRCILLLIWSQQTLTRWIAVETTARAKLEILYNYTVSGNLSVCFSLSISPDAASLSSLSQSISVCQPPFQPHHPWAKMPLSREQAVYEHPRSYKCHRLQ